MVDPVLELKGISKKLKGREILKNINLTINPSEIFGFLGPNGAGKTTTIRIIAGLVKPTTGSVTICGYSLEKEFSKALSRVGCIIEGPDMYKYFTGMENLEQFAAMKNVERKRIYEVLELVGLQHRINDKVGTYSLGMRQRMGIAQALLSRPKLLILDEPTNGLDPAGIAEFRQLMRKLAYEEGMSVFVSSHILTELQLMCDTVSIVKQGEVIKTAKVEEIQSDNVVEWQFEDVGKAKEILKSKLGLNVTQTKKNIIRAPIGKLTIEEINRTFMNEGLVISYCTAVGSSLEDLFLDLTEGDKIV
ncbi:ABC transporter ATP-binding protein [Desulfosporosinus sp. SB140]|uniref:ABC transporter ATP-binding protein n=1 Tax=Desulfosporosinus paludis TaxID=3115649 RepID=UPI00388F8D85